MSGPTGVARRHARWRVAARRLRGVRARLVAVYLVVAAVVAVVGGAVFVLLLSRTLHRNVDSELRATADAFATDVRRGRIYSTPEAVPAPPGRVPREVSTVVAVYAPTGLVETEPSTLPGAAPVSAGPAFQTVRYVGREMRLHRENVQVGGATWTVVVGRSLLATDDATADARSVLFVIVPVVVLLSGIGAWLLSGAALRPVERMRADAQRLSETDSPGSIGVPGTADNLDRLARTFNALLQRLHASTARQRDLVADAGHELRTPLAVLQTELDTAVRPGRTRADLADSIGHARAEVAVLAALSEDLLLLAQADGPERLVRPERVDPGDVVRRCVDAHRAAFDDSGVVLRVNIEGTSGGPEPEPADVDPLAVRRILGNLLDNARRHTPPGGSVDVCVTSQDGGVELTVADNGEGFPAEFLPHAFERFARADRSRSRSSADGGSGLGLSVVATLAEAHGGNATALNRDRGGAEVRVVLHGRAR